MSQDIWMTRAHSHRQNVSKDIITSDTLNENKTAAETNVVQDELSPTPTNYSARDTEKNPTLSSTTLTGTSPRSLESMMASDREYLPVSSISSISITASPERSLENTIVHDKSAQLIETPAAVKQNIMKASPRTLESMLASQTEASQTGVSVIQTLVTESMLPTATSTPTQVQLTKIQRSLIEATTKIEMLQKEIGEYKTDLLAANLQITLKEEEIRKLKDKLPKSNRKANKDSVIQSDASKKQISLLETENKKLKADIEKLEECMATNNTPASTVNRYLVLENANQKAATSSNVASQTYPQNHKNDVTTTNAAIQTCPSTDDKEDVLYFRGWKDPLSPFYTSPLTYNHITHKTLEHCYHHEKALFHGNRIAAREIYHARTPGEAKRIANKWFPTCSSKWNDSKFKIMEELCLLQSKQCAAFRSKLINSKNHKLVHNMESDGLWGFGADGRGRNEMGNILMRVRDRLCPPTSVNSPATVPPVRSYAAVTAGSANKSSQQRGTQANNTSENGTHKKPSVVIIGNSNVRGLAAELNACEINATAYVYGGTPTDEIRKRIKYCVPDKSKQPPSHVVLHTGDIDVRQSPQKAERDVLRAIDETLQQFPQSRVLISTPSAQTRDLMLKSKIKDLNRKIKDKCEQLPELAVIDCTNLPLRDNIHLSRTGRKEQAIQIAKCINYT